MLLSLPRSDELFSVRVGWAVYSFAWPHAAYWMATRKGASPRAERYNVLLDSVYGGIAAAVLELRLWPVAAICVMGIINALLFGGPRFLAGALALFLGGLLAAGGVWGLRPHIETEPLPTFLSLGAIFAYVVLIGTTAYRLRLRQRQTRVALEAEERRSSELLLNIFPAGIVPRLRAGESPIADQHADVTVIFADIVEFTPLAERLGPRRTVLLLNDLYRRFDQAARQFGVEKIETTGDGYLAVAGAPGILDEHPQAAARFALALAQAARETPIDGGGHVQVRIGLHTGPVFGGVVGESRFHYKVFGDTVNTASRVQSHSLPGAILLSEATYKRLRQGFVLADHGVVELKGRGPMRTYWLTG